MDDVPVKEQFDIKGFLVVLLEKSVTIAIGMMLMFVIGFKADFDDVHKQCLLAIEQQCGQSSGMESQLFKDIKVNIPVNNSNTQGESLIIYNNESVQQ